ncbi:GNAT family N-acetyltransferase [Peterkaempfera bronchialis]|uniref:GNAT family N-acetyltransferase n=2 Tax=Peterkaempfera bronchialis TaxID=2126346 RepID=A0A345STW6_9ACTN|nr:GNAT family N-acetyltransferase [Peterkaempfera bronchialis]
MIRMPGDDLIIRPAAAADDGPLAELDRRCWSRLAFVIPRPEPGTPFFDERHRPDRYRVAELGGRAVGYIRVVPSTSLACNAHVRQIQGLTVDDEVRGRGVGRALVEAACGWAREEGATRLTLRVLGHNAPARALYERCGFAVEGVLPGEFLLDGRYVDDVLMGRSLVAG